MTSCPSICQWRGNMWCVAPSLPSSGACTLPSSIRLQWRSKLQVHYSFQGEWDFIAVQKRYMYCRDWYCTVVELELRLLVDFSRVYIVIIASFYDNFSSNTLIISLPFSLYALNSPFEMEMGDWVTQRLQPSPAWRNCATTQTLFGIKWKLRSQAMLNLDLTSHPHMTQS